MRRFLILLGWLLRLAWKLAVDCFDDTAGKGCQSGEVVGGCESVGTCPLESGALAASAETRDKNQGFLLCTFSLRANVH